MKIFIHLPTWLGDAVMASPALYAIKEHFKNPSLSFMALWFPQHFLKNFLILKSS